MNQEQAVVNRIWSETLLEEIHRFGAEHVCIAPGSRSTPLTLQAAEHPQLKIHTHYDERGIGFYALGLAKATQKPVVVVVTSGTAVANLLPAIAEANLTGEKLVVLTADRPIELIDCGANQAIEQTGIFSHHVTGAINLPSPSTSTPLAWLLTSVDQLLDKQAKQGGAIHINCAYPEPLYTDLPLEHHAQYRDAVIDWRENGKTYIEQVHPQLSPCVPLQSIERAKGVIVLGSVDREEAKAVKALAERLQWPLLADPQSGVSSAWAHFDIWLQNEVWADKLASCDLIVQFGARLVSKRLNQWIEQQVALKKSQYWLVTPQDKRLNPAHVPQTQYIAPVSNWVSWVNDNLLVDKLEHGGWERELSPMVVQLKQLIASESPVKASELGLALALSNFDNVDLFIGNSLFVRLVDMFSDLDGNRVYTNRGASGIDGLIATASGVFQGNQRAGVAVLGDTSLLYDLNSLALLKHAIEPVVVFVTNNDGGSIFELLPVPDKQKIALYQMPHGMDFKYAAKQFGLTYLLASEMKQTVQAAKDHLKSGQGTLLVEIQTPPDEASKTIKKVVSDSARL
ncbi:2-succinyl-5-enolpyruvyl-6-hydroxy-3-cyclohexene-1-carboxylic-acid synthase [Vibrio sonorensis]|uniref:2-succinyl-5-enolpyruvyl-6-hydroxy-3- cyclohexene-1-carboxylic-acid synthase n=1 Tax=Vibrio sonorensis TaxID=1004316 RepID=UPI0008D8D899|nr:2-succinyl-5-enolpyruvyl-6-hydroxy-3-cyclohexene-1-carboxylic-acid synthase [Vibrio sonorensis]